MSDDAPESKAGYVPGETDVRESDPNADSDAGLAGGMGVSSEHLGNVPGQQAPATHGAEETHPRAAEEARDESDPTQTEDGHGGTPPQR